MPTGYLAHACLRSCRTTPNGSAWTRRCALALDPAALARRVATRGFLRDNTFECAFAAEFLEFGTPLRVPLVEQAAPPSVSRRTSHRSRRSVFAASAFARRRAGNPECRRRRMPLPLRRTSRAREGQRALGRVRRCHRAELIPTAGDAGQPGASTSRSASPSASSSSSASRSSRARSASAFRLSSSSPSSSMRRAYQ